MFKLQLGPTTLFLLPSSVELKRLEHLLVGTSLLLHNLGLSL